MNRYMMGDKIVKVDFGHIDEYLCTVYVEINGSWYIFELDKDIFLFLARPAP